MQTNGKRGNWQIKGAVAVLILMAVQTVAQSSVLSASARSPRVVLVSIPERKLVVVESGTVIASFPVAVGATKTPSPTGEFQIINRLTNPTYYHPRLVIPAGKHNPLGTRWIGLSKNGYGIHGTNVPNSVGRAASHGCIRLRNRDIEQLFTMVRVGDRVEIHGEWDERISRVMETGSRNQVASTTAVALESAGQ